MIKVKVAKKAAGAPVSPPAVVKSSVTDKVQNKGGKLVIASASYQLNQLQKQGVKVVDQAPAPTKADSKKRIREDEKDEEEPPAKKKKEDDNLFAKHFELPDSWGAHPDMSIKEVAVPPDSQEFQKIEKMVSGTVADYHKNNTGNHPVKFTTLKVTRVVRIQNPTLWLLYNTRKKAMIEQYNKKPSNQVTKVLTGLTTDAVAQEYFLFHGLNENGVPGITRFGFDPRFCSLKGMFGAGIYFADNSSKANQYCHGGSCTASGFLTGRAQCRCKKTEEACMMLCRVALGDPWMEIKYRGNKNPGDFWFEKRCEVSKPGGGVYNSVIGESQVNGGSILLLREYVVYEASQTYPEYIIYYKRV